jgi:hypothetical protein
MTTLNDDIKRQAKLYVPLFSAALKIAIAEDNIKKIKELAAKAREHYTNLSSYIDECDPTLDLDPELLVLADYFLETAQDIESALKRPPEGEEWKDETG